MALVKTCLRKWRVTDVPFLLPQTNMVILPSLASLISLTHTYTQACTVQSQLANTMLKLPQ